MWDVYRETIGKTARIRDYFPETLRLHAEPLGHYQKDTYYQIDYRSGPLLSISQSDSPAGKDPRKLVKQATGPKNWKASDSKEAGVEIDQYGDHFVEKDQSFHVFYDSFFWIPTGTKIIVE